MKKAGLYIYILIAGIACKKEGLMRYQGGNSIFMYIQGFWIFQSDSTTVNFALTAGQQTTQAVDFSIVGQLAPVNRKFKLVVSDSSTAIANRDYILPPADSFYIPANGVSTSIPITVLRSRELYEKSVELILKLQPNENFATNLPLYPPPEDQPIVKSLTAKITIADKLDEPEDWNNSKGALGAFTRKKITLMAKELSLELNEFYRSGFSAVQLKNFARAFQAYLNQQKALGNVISEEDGTPMVMGPDAQ